MATYGNGAATFFVVLLLAGSSLVSAWSATGRVEPLGTWKLLHRSIGISAMHMQLLSNNHVVMFDRTEVGPSNLTLPYPFQPSSCRPSIFPPHRHRHTPRHRGGVSSASYPEAGDSPALAPEPAAAPPPLDCTAHALVYDIATDTFRPLVVQTDTWCSSGAVLPNGTLVQTGGYGTGDRVVRVISPEPFAQWDEHPGYLAVRRWYASNQILPDGRIIIVGGRREFSYEFFPKPMGEPGSSARTRATRHGVIEFPFLLETKDRRAENNLYPFLHLLPDGTLFVFANNRAVILDYDAHRVVRTLPRIPGGDPRSYPSSGSSVLLPLHIPTPRAAPQDVVAEVLVCGGAPKGSFQRAKKNKVFLPALRTCARIVATDPAAQWEMETMPMVRVMGDMLMLPTGDVLIINGAANGSAGWELGRDPETRPLLYRHTLEPARRFKLLAPSSIPRMYHSSAVVDPYGRVLVGGSNPHVHYNFSPRVMYPTDLSLQAFHPPYLDQAFDLLRPSLTSSPTRRALRYGEPLLVRFTVPHYRPDLGVRVALLAPAFATHAFSMNQRLLQLAPRAVGPDPTTRPTYRILTAAPPTPALAPPGYYLLFVIHAGVPSTGVWVKIAL